MALLIIFAFVAGAGTALSPCVLPVLPVVLSAGATGGRRRPVGIVTGLALSFTFATVALVYVIDALGLPDDLLRKLAIAILLLFGLSLLVPFVAAHVEARLSRLTGRAAVTRRGDGFGSGVLVGSSLGLVYAPCAGPILAGVITVSASQAFTAGRLAVALSYGAGSAVVLYLLMLGGRRLTSGLARRSGRLQMAMGAVMVLVAVAMFANYDVRFETAIASHVPSVLVDPTKKLETTSATNRQLARLRRRADRSSGAAAFAASATPRAAARRPAAGGDRLRLPVLGAAPDFRGNQQWFNTPGNRPLSLRSLRGRVVLVDFWTYSCINCIRTLPYLKAWDARYRAKGLTIVGVHTPEFPFEKSASNVHAAIKQNALRYPVAQDNDYATWEAYRNEYWPAEYFIDARGRVRFTHFGEGDYARKEQVIRTLLAEAGASGLGPMSHARGIRASATTTTPESYLGAARAERFVNGPIRPGPRDFGPTAARLPVDHLAYSGAWRIGADSTTALSRAGLDLRFDARRVYLVLGSPSRPRRVRVLLDGRAISAKLAGADVRDANVTVRAQRLYRLVDLPAVARHRLRLEFQAGVAGYAFTFG
jgi:cytochrome c biogenesis protein CcdA/thiol-disulfide isomerase/thioredoxin